MTTQIELNDGRTLNLNLADYPNDDHNQDTYRFWNADETEAISISKDGERMCYIDNEGCPTNEDLDLLDFAVD